MDYVKRTNLAFDLRKAEHNDVYDLINKQPLKTDYVVKAVLEYEERHSEIITKEFIKEAIKQALQGIEICNIGITSKQEEPINEKEKIPEEIFDLFDKM